MVDLEKDSTVKGKNPQPRTSGGKIQIMQYEILGHREFHPVFFTADQLKKQVFDGFLGGDDLIRLKGSTERARPARKYKELREQFNQDEELCIALKSKDPKGRLLALANAWEESSRSATSRTSCAVIACADPDAAVRGYAREILHVAGDLRAVRYSEILERRFHLNDTSEKEGIALVKAVGSLLALAPVAARVRAAILFATLFPASEFANAIEFAKLTTVENDDRFWRYMAERIIEVAVDDESAGSFISLEYCPVARLDLLGASARRQLLATFELTLDVSKVVEFPSFFSKAKAVRLTLRNCFWDALHAPIYDMHLSGLTIDGGRFGMSRLFLAEQERDEEDWFDESNGFRLVLRNVEKFTPDCFSQEFDDERDEMVGSDGGIEYHIELDHCGRVNIGKWFRIKSLDISCCPSIGGDETEPAFWESLSKVPGKIKSLSIRHCELQCFPRNSWMGATPSAGREIRLLDLSNNRISKWADETEESDSQWASEIYSVRLDGNQLRSIPSSIHHLPRLKCLSVSRNHLEYLPEWTTRMSELDVSHNAISVLPSGDWARTISSHVKHTLDVSHNPIKAIPPEIFSPSLNSLNCSDTKLTELPDTLSLARHLEWLSLDRCPLNDLPNCDWPNALRQLSLRELHIGHFPTSVLGSLNQLSLCGASISGLSMLAGVRPLWLPSEQKTGLCVNASRSSIHLLFEHVQYLTELCLDECSLSEVPEWIQWCHGLRSLSLQSNKIQTIPSWLGKLRCLAALDLSRNPINTIESSFEGIGSLERLSLSCCNLTEGAHFIGKCSKLSDLSITEGRVSGSVDWIESLTNLQRVSFERLLFDGLSEHQVPHPNLKTLNLGGASIDSLPNWICCSPHLEELYISGTKITELPSQLFQSKSINRISLPEQTLGLNCEKLALMPNLCHISLGGSRQVNPSEMNFLSPFIDWE